MAFILEMVRGDSDVGREFCYCSIFHWNQILEIAQKFGWMPEGAMRDSRAQKYTKDYDEQFDSSYNWSEWAYCKRFSSSDAKAMSEALMLSLVHMEKNQDPSISEKELSIFADEELQHFQLKKTLIGIAKFAAKGEFAFAVDD